VDRAITCRSSWAFIFKTPSFTDQDCVEQFYRDFKQQGISRDRLILRGPSGLDDMMQEYLQIDIGLDPLPYNGGTTTLQALWMGVPIISLAGDNFCGRMGASILHYAGLDDWIAESEADYIAIAQQKASQRVELRKLKSGLRAHLKSSPLFDNEGFTRALETAY
jgi:predicted O-linked N-acetylglucosamine transferase (SPINDLY family)